jgi:hypothetical protein
MPKPNLSKTTNFLDQIEFENDFGQEPIGVGRFTEDKAVVGVFSMAIAFVGWTITPPLAVIVALVWWNDVKSLDGGSSPERKKRLPVVDTTAEEVYDDEEEDYYEEPVSYVQDEPKREKQAPRKESARKAPARASESVEVEETPSTSEWQWGEDGEPNIQDIPRRSCRQKSTEPRRESNIPIPQLPQVTTSTRKELIERLKQDCPALLRIVKDYQPIRLVGMQRTGKTTWAIIFGLLRMVLFSDHRVLASTIHNEKENQYPNVFDTVGLCSDGSRDYVGVRDAWNELYDKIEDGCMEPITYFWDEFGLQDLALAKAIGGRKPDKSSMQQAQEEVGVLMTSGMRESAKHNKSLVFLVHGETAAFLPGVEGLVKVFLNGTVRVETIGEPVEDEDGLAKLQPTGKFTITYLDKAKTTESGQIPEWLTQEYLLGLLGNPIVDKTKSPKKSEEGFTVSDGLKEPFKTIYSFAKQQGDWITARDIQRKEFAVLKGKPVKTIRQYLGLMHDMELGEIDEQDKSDSAVGFLAK